ncbi:aspartic peptidase domain-containing protein [Dichotomocladium elegans]|nr:aspartic peptidase domain-containing protein [Dichotomocladium elegans]
MIMKGIVAATLWAGFAALSTAQTFTAPLKRYYDPESVSIPRRALLGKRQTSAASERLYNVDQAFYMIEVQVGTPAQTFHVQLDTGSPSFWLPDIPCTTGCPGGQFNPASSSSFKSLNIPFGIEYAIGSANGTYGTDTVSIAGLTVTDQIFGLVNSTKSTIVIQNGTASVMIGIMGLGYPMYTQVDGPLDINFAFNLANRSIISEPIFSIFLDSQYRLGYSGEITFGGIDTSKYTGSLTYVPVVPFRRGNSDVSMYIFWAAGGLGAKTSNGYAASFTSAVGFVMDTGTTFTYMPAALSQDLVNSVVGSAVTLNTTYGFYDVPCSLASSTATITLLVASSLNDANSPPVELTVGMNELVIPLGSNSVKDSAGCVFGIAPMPGDVGVSSDTFIVGDTFLRSFYTVYDMGQNRIGFAAAKVSTGSPIATSGIPKSSAMPSATPSKESAADSIKPAISAVAIVTMSMLALATIF